MRPGRLDRLVYVGPPDLHGREEILHICVSKMSVDPMIDISEIASLVCVHIANVWPFLIPLQTEGCSGAEVVSICQEAALLTMKDDIDAPFVSYRSRATISELITKRIERYRNARLSQRRKG